MEGFHAGIIVWISLTAKGMQDFFPAQAMDARIKRNVSRATIVKRRWKKERKHFRLPEHF